MENVTAPAAPAVSSGAPAVAPKADNAVAPKASVSPAVKVDEDGVGEAPKRIYKLNVNGKEVEYDASNEDKLKSDLQKVFGIEEKARTSAQKVDMADRLLDMLQSDPRGFEKQCKLAGIDVEKLAVDILWNRQRLNSLSPEQRELEEYKEREKEVAATKAQQEADAKVAESTKKTQEWAQKFEAECSAALSANSIPKTRLSLALIAQYIDAGLSNKKEYTVEQVLPYVARDLKEIHRSTMESLDGDALLSYIGETLANKIAKARVDRYKRTTANPVPEKKTVSDNPRENKDISKLKGKAYWKALRQQKSEAGIGLHPGAPGNY
jgi:hypothetical protein